MTDVAVKTFTVSETEGGKRIDLVVGERLQLSRAKLRELFDAEAVRLGGRKAKKGFYTYGEGKKKEVDTSVYGLLPHGATRKHLDRAEMAERCALQMINEAVRCLGEGILRSPRDGDIGAIFGLGFPPFLGGPFRYADAQGLGRILLRTEHYQERFGARFTPAPLLAEYVKAGKKFHQS